MWMREVPPDLGKSPVFYINQAVRFPRYAHLAAEHKINADQKIDWEQQAILPVSEYEMN